MALKVVMPKLGLTMTEGKIVRWLKKEGEWVEKGEPLLEILTEKISTEVESPGQGFLAKIISKPGDVVPITNVIAILASEGEDISSLEGETADKPSIGTVSASVTTPVASLFPTGKEGRTADYSGRVKASPLARRIASDKDMTVEDLKNIAGTGPGGRIVKKDILAYSAAGKPQQATASVTSNTVQLTELRQIIAKRLTHSWTTTPHFYLEAEVEIVELSALRASMNKVLTNKAINISINDLIVKAVAAVLARHSYINASFTEEGIILKEEINIGIAVGLDEGLIVPVLHNANRKGLEEISRESRNLIEKARNGGLAMNDITGGTFTISNLGMFSVDAFTAIINPPESAILAVGKIAERLVLEDGEVVSKAFMRITAGFDHRVVDGLTGARFLADLKETLENPFMMIL
jgi:pyruvate dehydrogenase E2 component (dihydrolipoamide acetyltransferase)